MKRDFQTPAIVALVIGLAAMAFLGRSLASARAAATGPVSATPWVRYVMVGLGGFRGVIAEVLWMRAARLQEQGRYFELVQLSEWINSLDPSSADAWAFNAWNLSYNISAMLPDPAARLKWVRAGISLLRDRAIPANPSAPSLYRELGWLYQNKIGSADDSAHMTYRLSLAAETEADLAGEDVTAPLDRQVMAEIEARFGKLDWRLPQAHAVYWAWKGLALKPQGFEDEALRRMVQQNLVVLVGSGKFTGDTAKGHWSTAPDFDILPGLMSYYEERIETDPSELKIYCVFLDNVARLLKEAGRDDLAQLVVKRLQELDGR